jgi:hypothetical protein
MKNELFVMKKASLAIRSWSVKEFWDRRGGEIFWLLVVKKRAKEYHPSKFCGSPFNVPRAPVRNIT